MSSKFLSYILNLRGAAIFIVVGVHARGNATDWKYHETSLDLLSTLFDAREGTGTVMFIFIGGFLFQYITSNSFNFKKYMEKKFMYVILPYILISIPIIAYRIYTGYTNGLPASFADQSIFYQFFHFLVTGLHLAPFWFISAIVLFYFSAPIFHALDNPVGYRWVLPLLLITSFFSYRSEHNANPLLSYLHYFPIYYFGMWASYYRNKILMTGNYLLYPMLIIYLGITVATLLHWIPTPERLSFEQVVREGMLVFNIDLLRAILLSFILMIVLYKVRNRRLLLLEVLGEYSFGIFFVHCIFIYGTDDLWIRLTGAFSMLSFLIYFAFILIVSIIAVSSIKKITGRYSRNLIGS